MPHHQDDNQHPHLEFMREDISAERRKKSGFGGTRPDRGGREVFAPQLIEATDRLSRRLSQAYQTQDCKT